MFLFLLLLLNKPVSFRVCMGPGKSWNVAEFKIQILQALKVMESG